MMKNEAVELCDYIVNSARRKAVIRELGNGEHVVILTQRGYFLWSAEDWEVFRQMQEDVGQTAFSQRVMSTMR